MFLFYGNLHQFWHLSNKMSLIKWISHCLFIESVLCCDRVKQNLLLVYSTLLYTHEVNTFSPCSLHLHQLYDAASLPGSLAIILKYCSTFKKGPHYVEVVKACKMVWFQTSLSQRGWSKSLQYKKNNYVLQAEEWKRNSLVFLITFDRSKHI